MCVPLSTFVSETLLLVPLDNSFPSIASRRLCPERREGSEATEILTFPVLLLIAEPSAGLETNNFL